MPTQPNQGPLDLSKGLDPSLWPDISTWRKAMPQILAYVAAIGGMIAVGNWWAVGVESIKDLPDILKTFGIAIPSGLSLLAAPLVDFLNHRDRKSAQALFDQAAKAAGIYDVDPNAPRPVQPIAPQPVVGPVAPPPDPNKTHLSFNSPDVSFDLTYDPNKGDGTSRLVDTLSAAFGKKPEAAKITLESTATPHAP